MPALPTTNLTLHTDASDNDKLFTTFNGGGSGVHTGVVSDGATANIWEDEGDGVSDVILIYGGAVGTGGDWRQATPLMPQPCLDFNGTTKSYECWTQTGATAKPISTLITASAFTILIAFYAEAIATSAANVYDNAGLLSNAGNYLGLFLKNVSGTYKLFGYNYDGADRVVPAAGLTITLNTPYVAMFRLESGTLSLSLNGGAESPVASGPTQLITGNLVLGQAVAFFNGRIGELAVYNVGLTGATLTNALAYFTDKWLPAVPPGILISQLERRMPRGLSRGVLRGVA